MNQRNETPLSAVIKVLYVVIALLLFQGDVATAQQDKLDLEYKWEQGKSYGYEFEVKHELDDETEYTSGFVTFKPEKKNVNKDLAGTSLEIFEEGEATSTAFAVTSDGFLMTCAHCVRGAKAIEVMVGEKTFQATIVEVDYDQDLAIIKVDAKDLPIVPLGKNVKVELAQDVRAIGYPLSDVLGSSVKVTRGSIAGFVDAGDSKTLQIDAAVNHGNSGGPLVDAKGVVIGVVNAKLSGAEIAKVGFAVPIELACQMLDDLEIEYDSTVSTEVLTGPELAKKIAPAVFFVKAEIGPGGANDFKNFQFSTKGSVKRPSINRRVGATEIVDGRAIVDADGNLLDSSNETRLPLLLGSISELPFEALPGKGRRTWSRTEMVVLSLPKSTPQRTRSTSPFDPFGHLPGFHSRGFGGMGPFGGFGGFGPPGFRRSEPESKTEMRMALGHMTTNYKVVNQENEFVTISKKYELKTIGDDDEFSNVRIIQEGTLTFDTKRGIFTAKKMKGNVKLKLGKKDLNIPVEMSYRQIELDHYLKSSPGKSDEGEDLATGESDAMPAVGLSEKQIEQFVNHSNKKLESRELLFCLNKLAGWNDSPGNQEKIVSAIEEVIESNVSGARKSAIDALLNWDPSAATPHVVEEFSRANAFSKRSWILKLGRTGQPEAALVLCKQLSNSRTRTPSRLALIELGVAAEDAVINTLKTNVVDTDITNSCLSVLGEIGTEKSSEALQELIDQPEWASKVEAQGVLKAINGRKK